MRPDLLPRRNHPALLSGLETLDLTSKEGGTIRILVVEDEPNVAELILDALKSAGHDCMLAYNAEEADRVLSAQQVDGITLDIRMPGRDGLDWLRSLWTSHPQLARRTLVITGTTLSPEDCHHLARCGASMLAKPFGVEDLVETISKQLSPLHGPPLPGD